MNRDAIMSALFALVTSVPGFMTTGRRLLLWTEVPEQPALFVRHIGDEIAPRAARGLPPKTTMRAEVWIYAQMGTDPESVPGAALDSLVDAVSAAMAPSAFTGVQTLGGLVSHCWIEGSLHLDPGDIDGQAKAIIPVHILVPS